MSRLARAAALAAPIATAVAVLALTVLRDRACAPPLALGAGGCACLAAALRIGGRASNCLTACASLALGGALLLCVAGTFRQTIALEGESDLIAHDAILGWALRPGAHHVVKTVNGRAVYDVVYTVDATGHRVTRSAADGPVMAFLGDSFTFGEGVPNADTLPQAFADLTRS